jgi:hypothetical protein
MDHRGVTKTTVIGVTSTLILEQQQAAVDKTKTKFSKR